MNIADLRLGFRQENPYQQKTKNFSICLGLTSVEIFELVVKEGGFNGESYFQFLTNLFVNLEKRNIVNATIIADNLPFYKIA